MEDRYKHEPMMEMFIFETSQLIEQLEHSILHSEKESCYTPEAINEIFRIMHTIKGSSAMMLFNTLSTLAHTMEDVFYFLREQKPQNVDCSTLTGLVLEGVDFIKAELEKIKAGNTADGNAGTAMDNLQGFLAVMKQGAPSQSVRRGETQTEGEQTHFYIGQQKPLFASNSTIFKAVVFFENGCEMENIRAYSLVHHLKELAQELVHDPRDLMEDDATIQVIREQGFRVYIQTDKTYEEIHRVLDQTLFLKELELVQLDSDEEMRTLIPRDTACIEGKLPGTSLPREQNGGAAVERETNSSARSIISVHVNKLDKLMDLVGEMVIAEAMVTQNPDLIGLQLDNFMKAARQLRKITGELQDMVMSIRMVPLSTTFHKMYRIARDMSRKLDREVQLQLLGEETEVDKNIIEHISDPLMHLVRNAIDHGLESAQERAAKGKPRTGTVTLEARNVGGEVLVMVKDDGKGLNKERILRRARENGLLTRPEGDMSDREIYNLIFLPGFSTKESVSEFSGRGVGMDVVVRNIESVGGSVFVDSAEGAGTTVTLKIPLTLAIIDGMNVRVGSSRYTLPTTAIKESFRPRENDIIKDPDGNEMIMVRGRCYPIVRLHVLYGVKTQVTDFVDGILIMVEQDDQTACLFADELLGQQQVVVKALPNYIRDIRRIRGLAGCTLLGDGSISLILDTAGLVSERDSLKGPSMER